MPSSILFAALSIAWLAVLVPMFARRRQAVSRINDATLAARVVRRGSGGAPDASITAADAEDTTDGSAAESDNADVDPDLHDDYPADRRGPSTHGDDARVGRKYRPGRGGFDPEAAALAARAKYSRRQRIVLCMLLISITTAVLAALLWTTVWWINGVVDLIFVGYLVYLRRQVRIEEDVRNRRLARMAAPDIAENTEDEPDDEQEPDENEVYDLEAEVEPETSPEPQPPVIPSLRRASPDPEAIALEIDDEDPMFEELDEHTWESYRRAAGE